MNNFESRLKNKENVETANLLNYWTIFINIK